MQYLENLTVFEQWLVALCAFVVSLGLFLWLRRLFWRRLRALTSATASHWDDLLLDSVAPPVTVIVVIAAAGVGAQFAPEVARAHPALLEGLKIAGIVSGIWMVDRVIMTAFQTRLLPATLGGSSRLLLSILARVFFIGLGLLVVLDTIGVSITPLLASLGVGSVAVALALQDTLSNFFSGIYLLVDKPIRPGDFVRIDSGVEGTVTQIGWRSTHVRLLANNTVILPNSKIAFAQITNFDFPEKELAVLLDVGVSYQCDLPRVEAVTIEVARQVLASTPGGVCGFDPFIRYKEFADSGIVFSVILRGQQFTDQYLIKHEFIKALHARFRQEGIEIPYPQRVVHLVGGDRP